MLLFANKVFTILITPIRKFKERFLCLKQNQKNILIFLDIDGVLNTTNSHISKYEIHEENVNALKKLKN